MKSKIFSQLNFQLRDKTDEFLMKLKRKMLTPPTKETFKNHKSFSMHTDNYFSIYKQLTKSNQFMKIFARKGHLQNKKRTEKLTEKGASHVK